MCTQTHRHATECQTRNWVRVEILFTAGVPAYIILSVMKAMLTSGCVEAFERKAYIYIWTVQSLVDQAFIKSPTYLVLVDLAIA